ncbi:hypothetical protein NM09_12745 [Vibrio caribbeanicus]|uniref:Uncharacterized protein n=1 Tax=Vibrio caribbeanicus TaxID=701175 RepID=A0ACC4NVA7_9VIBR|nr:hypothetical protein NM09_12745 [Vibrio caribbeanicus]
MEKMKQTTIPILGAFGNNNLLSVAVSFLLLLRQIAEDYTHKKTPCKRLRKVSKNWIFMRISHIFASFSQSL